MSWSRSWRKANDLHDEPEGSSTSRRIRDLSKARVLLVGAEVGKAFWTTATKQVRAVREQRRMEQQKIKGEVAANLAADLRERDRRDRTRAASPLQAAEDAVVIDSTKMGEDEVLARVEELARQKLGS